MSAPLLRAQGLSVHAGPQRLLRALDFSLHPGDALVLLGESGAGKSLLAQAIMGQLPAPLQAQGQVHLGHHGSDAARPDTRRHWWGRHLALLPQEPTLALDALRPIDPQLHETLRLVAGLSPAHARSQATAHWQAAGLADARHLRPAQLSGGMAQRAASVLALAGGAPVLLADEPTKGLDAHWVQQTLHSLTALRQAGGAVVVITHDLRVARALGGRLMVLQHGEVVEQGDTAQVLAAPRHAFTRRLLAADPSRWPQRAGTPASQAAAQAPWVLQAQGLRAQVAGLPGTSDTRTLFNALSFDFRRGQRVVLQGPSGVGKSTLGRVLLGLQAPHAGTVQLAPGLPATARQKLYQDPAHSFAPRVPLRDSLADVARHHRCPWSQVQAWLAALQVPEALLGRRPAQVSGGELQRLAIARVLCARPALLFADEPTSRLDAVTQQDTVQALLHAVDELAASLVLVTHDDDLARAVADVHWRW